MKIKTIKIISILIAIVIVAYSFVVTNKTEDYPYQNNIGKIESSTIKNDITPEKITDSIQKYTIKNSTVIPIDPTNHKKIVLLTIDDGPSKRTLDIVKILEAHNAKAIFFINGMNNKANPHVIQEVSSDGFAIGNHTWSHINLKKEKDLNVIKSEINKNSELIKNETGSYPLFFRPPYGEINTYTKDLIKSEGMIFMNWSGSAIDWDKSTIEKDIFVSNVTNNLHSGSIILIHEHPWSVANLDSLLTTLDNSGYTYVNPTDIIE